MGMCSCQQQLQRPHRRGASLILPTGCRCDACSSRYLAFRTPVTAPRARFVEISCYGLTTISKLTASGWRPTLTPRAAGRTHPISAALSNRFSRLSHRRLYRRTAKYFRDCSGAAILGRSSDHSPSRKVPTAATWQSAAQCSKSGVSIRGSAITMPSGSPAKKPPSSIICADSVIKAYGCRRAKVLHIIPPEQLSPAGLRRHFYAYGRSLVRQGDSHRTRILSFPRWLCRGCCLLTRPLIMLSLRVGRTNWVPLLARCATWEGILDEAGASAPAPRVADVVDD